MKVSKLLVWTVMQLWILVKYIPIAAMAIVALTALLPILLWQLLAPSVSFFLSLPSIIMNHVGRFFERN